MSWQSVFYIPEHHVIERFDAELDYAFGKDLRKLPRTRTYMPGALAFVRRMVDGINAEVLDVTRLCCLHPLRAELELKEYGRGVFRDSWDVAKGNKCVSVPVLTFIDGYGLYRNSYNFDCDNLETVVLKARKSFQSLCTNSSSCRWKPSLSRRNSYCFPRRNSCWFFDTCRTG